MERRRSTVEFPITLKPGEHGIGSPNAKRFTFEIGGGAARITAETFSGDITISPTDAAPTRAGKTTHQDPTMTRQFASVALVSVLASAAGAQTRSDFRWEKALPAGNEVSIHNINGDITVRRRRTAASKSSA